MVDRERAAKSRMPPSVDDAARSNPWTEDAFRFRPLAELIAVGISRISAEKGYVFGIHGTWGSGKTTLINFVRTFLDEWRTRGDLTDLVVFEFKPWLLSGHANLVAAFFVELSKAVERSGESPGFLRRLLRGSGRYLGRTADRGGSGGRVVVDAAKQLAAAAAIGSSFSGIAPAVAAVGVGGAWYLLAQMIRQRFRPTSIQDEHVRLQDSLRKQRTRYLVVIDDLDRLSDEEIREMLKMVKSIGGLPKVIYLLGYDRAALGRATAPLSSDGKGDVRAAYADKIVQYEVAVPPVHGAQLLELLAEQNSTFAELVGETSPRAYFGLIPVLERGLRTPRDVMRLANALNFTFAALGIEVDPHDVVLMEAHRLFLPKLWTWVRNSRHLLVATQLLSTQWREETIKRSWAALTQECSAAETSALHHSMAVLFPDVARILHVEGDKSAVAMNGANIGSAAHALRSIRTELGYDTYFALSPNPDFVTRADIDEVIRNPNDRSLVQRVISSALEQAERGNSEVARRLFNDLRWGMADHDQGANPEVMLREVMLATNVLVDFAIWKNTPGMNAFEASVSLVWALIAKVGDQRGEKLLLCLADVDSPETWAALYLEERSAQTNGKGNLPQAGYEEFGHRLLAHVLEAVQEGTLVARRRMFSALSAWAILGGRQEVADWIAGVCRTGDAQAFERLIWNKLGESTDPARRYFWPESETVEGLPFDPDVALDAARRHLASGSLSSDGVVMCEAIVRDLTRTTAETGREAGGTSVQDRTDTRNDDSVDDGDGLAEQR